MLARLILREEGLEKGINFPWLPLDTGTFVCELDGMNRKAPLLKTVEVEET